MKPLIEELETNVGTSIGIAEAECQKPNADPIHHSYDQGFRDGLKEALRAIEEFVKEVEAL